MEKKYTCKSCQKLGGINRVAGPGETCTKQASEKPDSGRCIINGVVMRQEWRRTAM